MGSELIYRGHELEPSSQSYSPKRPKPFLTSVSRACRYMLREQRLLFVLVGMAIAALFFTLGSRTSAASVGVVRQAIFSNPDRIPPKTFQSGYGPAIGSTMATTTNPAGKMRLGLQKKGLNLG